MSISRFDPDSILKLLSVYSVHDLVDSRVIRVIGGTVADWLITEWEDEIRGQGCTRKGFQLDVGPVFGGMSLEDEMDHLSELESGLKSEDKVSYKVPGIPIVLQKDLTCLLGRHRRMGNSLAKTCRAVTRCGRGVLSRLGFRNIQQTWQKGVYESIDAGVIQAFRAATAGYSPFEGWTLEHSRVEVSVYRDVSGALNQYAVILGCQPYQMIKLALAAGLCQSTNLIPSNSVRKYSREIKRMAEFLDGVTDTIRSSLIEAGDVLKRLDP